MGGRAGSGGGRTRGCFGNQGDGMMAATEPNIIQKVVQIAGTLTNKALRKGTRKKNLEKRENRGEPREVTRVRNLSVPPVAITIHLKHIVVVVSTVTAKDILLEIVEWCLRMCTNPVARTGYRCGSTDHINSACLRHVINGDGIHVDPSKIETVNNWEAPRSPSEVCSFLGLAGYYCRFIEDFSRIAKPLTVLTQKTLPDGPKDVLVYCHATGLGLCCVLMQRNKGDVRTLIMDEAHKSKYYVHPGANKFYYDLKDRYWWLGMKKDIAVYQPETPKWKWEEIAMDFVTKLPKTSIEHDTIWVIVDQLTKSSHFLPMREDYKKDRLARLYPSEIVAMHGVPISIKSDRDSRFTSKFWQSMQEALGT
nr:putative reverse transcriptase domain-containing protein [Tanacetum cinerariifolium]